MAGKYAGESVFIPRLPPIPNGDDLPVKWKRLQFPVRLSNTMTTNKSQGQSLEVVGLNLDKPVISHGQLYIGCSRMGNPKNLFHLTPGRKTKNVVYPKALIN